MHSGQLGNKYKDLFFHVVQGFISTYKNNASIDMLTALKFFCKCFGTKQPFLFSGFVKYLLQRDLVYNSGSRYYVHTKTSALCFKTLSQLS